MYKSQGTIQGLHEMLRDFDSAMLSTITSDGQIRARPMALQDPAEVSGCDLWFVTSIESGKVKDIIREEHVGVCCHRARDRAYVSVSAIAHVERDEALVRKLWKPSWKAWFPNGVEDPSIYLLTLQVQHAEYWEPEGGRVQVLFQLVKAMLKHQSAADALNPPKAF